MLVAIEILHSDDSRTTVFAAKRHCIDLLKIGQ